MSRRFQPVACMLFTGMALSQACLVMAQGGHDVGWEGEGLDTATAGGTAAATTAVVEMRVTLLSSASPQDTVLSVPTSLTKVQRGSSVVIEVWGQNANPPLDGFACVFVDVEFDASVFQATAAPAVGANFGLLAQSGTVDNTGGRIDEVGGCIAFGSSALGVIPEWVLVARASMTVVGDASGIGDLRVAPTGRVGLSLSLVGSGNVSTSAIDFGSLAVAVDVPGGVPILLSRSPSPNSVVNHTVGVTEIVAEFDRPVTVDSITIAGVNTGVVTGGSLLGNGAQAITRTLADTLPDQDRYTVTIQGPGLLEQWEFVTLIGDCDGNTVVNIFDLGRLRNALRNAMFDAECDIQPDGVINIFDLSHLRMALRSGASAP